MKIKFLVYSSMLSLFGCASNNMDIDNLLPRYVSPLVYLDYSCEQSQRTFKEFQEAKMVYQKLSKPMPTRVFAYKQRNEIDYYDTKLDQIGQSVLLGHEAALIRATKQNQCAF